MSTHTGVVIHLPSKRTPCQRKGLSREEEVVRMINKFHILMEPFQKDIVHVV